MIPETLNRYNSTTSQVTKIFKIKCIPQKRKYILLSTFERKTAFSAIFKPKSAGNSPFLVSFLCILAGWGLFCLL
jgi:hypothetical protein